jgi:hypothetical protein
LTATTPSIRRVTEPSEPTRADRLIQAITTISVVILALIAALLSYKHMYELVRRYGEARWSAALCPISVDGMIAAASMSLLADSRRKRQGGPLPWTLLVLGSLASLAANVAVSDPSTVGRLIAAWPSCAPIGSYELLMRQIRHAAEGRQIIIRRRQQLHAADASVHGGAASADRRSDAGHMNGKAPDSAPSRSPEWDIESSERLGKRRRTSLKGEAWAWALAHRRADGSLPSGAEIAAAFSMQERWGRLVKRAGLAKQLEPVVLSGEGARHDESPSLDPDRHDPRSSK